MSDADLARLAHLAIAIDHLEAHGKNDDAARLVKERDAILRPTPQQQQQKRR